MITMYALVRPSGQIVTESVGATRALAEQKRNRISDPKNCTVEEVVVEIKSVFDSKELASVEMIEEVTAPPKDIWAKLGIGKP
jgi:hypothetical protein